MAYYYGVVETNDSQAVQKAKRAAQAASNSVSSAQKRYNAARRDVSKYSHAPRGESSSAKAKRLRRLKNAKSRAKSNGRGLSRAKSALSKANSKLGKVSKTLQRSKDIQRRLDAQSDSWNNEGKCAIYPTNAADGSSIVFISPSDSESEANSTDITSWAVDKGAPRSSYARMSSKTIPIEGILTGSNGDNAHDKFVLLRQWHSAHTELTYRGDIYYKHLIMSSLQRDFTGLKDNLHVSITFTFVRAAEVTTSKSKLHKKSSKSHKTTAGRRHKKYTTITLKYGDTLYWLARKYHKSVKWLAKVNHIRNPNVIYAGRKIRVR